MSSDWNNVKEGLPDDDSRILVFYEDFIEIAIYNSEYYKRKGFWTFENGGEYEDDLNGKVTHWMELPKHPK